MRVCLKVYTGGEKWEGGRGEEDGGVRTKEKSEGYIRNVRIYVRRFEM